MFVYTVYPVTGTSRGKPAPAVRPVDRVAGVEPAHGVLRTWTEQYGNAGQAVRAFEQQAVSRDYLRVLREAHGGADSGAGQGQRAESWASAPVYLQSMQRLLPLRKPGATVDPDYIRKYLERLGNAGKNKNTFKAL